MRDYGRVFSAFWQSEEIRALPEDARTLALYLLTSPHANLIGCYRLTDAYAADDLQWEVGRVREGFAQLSAKGFVTRDEGSKWLLIHKYLKWNRFENANVAKAARKAFEQVPVESLKALLAKAFLEFGAHLSNDFNEALETLRKPFANPEPIQSQSLIPNQSQEGKGDCLPAAASAAPVPPTPPAPEPPTPPAPPPPPAPSKAERGKRLSRDWKLPLPWGAWALAQGYAEADIRIEATKFRNYWVAKSGKDATKLDWEATWQNWMLSSKAPRAGVAPGAAPVTVPPTETAAQYAERMAREREAAKLSPEEQAKADAAAREAMARLKGKAEGVPA